MNEICEYMLQWFFEVYENGEVEMSSEVYDRAVFVVGVGVPMLLFIAVCISFIFMFAACFDFARGRKR